ncbi:MAG: DUF3881 family protein [Lachnospiraceae bacterium]|nr:DUF3881 family protein [Lachnospiraceae bacterium]
MHKYLRAIGFSKTPTQEEMQRYIGKVIEAPTYRAYTSRSSTDDTLVAEFRQDMNRIVVAGRSTIGLAVYGTFDEVDRFSLDHVMPYLLSQRKSSDEEISVERRLDNESCAGACDDLKVGVTIIFRLLNLTDFIKHDFGKYGVVKGAGLSLTALSTEGTIVLPIEKTETEKRAQRKDAARRMEWMTKARDGDETAMRNLALEDMDHYAVLWNRVQEDDVYSLVENYFMPVGMECDLYSVMGEIRKTMKTENRFTGEKVYILTLDVNGLQIEVAINKDDLYGEPKFGRRFKGIIWMQGRIMYPE